MSDNASKIKWTKEQSLAINANGGNLLVSAAAGSGKTAVLVERIISNVIINNIDIDKLLVVTFTKAAAAEMKERIADSIYKKIESDSSNSMLKRQIVLLEKANICTIHAFCSQIIKENFHALDLDPTFRVCDESEALIILNDVLEEIFEERYEAENNIEFLNFIDWYGRGRNDIQAKELCLKIFRFASSHPFPEKWLDEKLADFNIDENDDFLKTIWGESILLQTKELLNGAMNICQKAIEILEDDGGLIGYYNVIKAEHEAIINVVKLIDDSATWNEVSEAINKVCFDRASSSRKDDKELREKVKALRASVKKVIADIGQEYFYLSSEEAVKTINIFKPVGDELIDLVKKLKHSYEQTKREKALLDFNDLEHLALKVLVDETEDGIKDSLIAKEYKDRFQEILIDEYQDSSHTQEFILKAISKGDNIFMVGDVKQSIYRFRQARPEIFLYKYNHFDFAKEKGGGKILLNKNFRSRKEIIDFINYLFSTLMSKRAGEIDYGEDEQLNLGSDYPEEKDAGSRNEFNIIDMKSQDEDSEEESPDRVRCEAQLAASKIINLINTEYKVHDKKTKQMRKIMYKDIAVLMRSISGRAEVFEEEFSKVGIPLFTDTSNGYFDRTEIRTIISLLRIIDNPLQDIPLVAVLRSSIVGIDEEVLSQVRLVKRKGLFYEALLEYAKQDNDNAKTIQMFLAMLSKWRKEARNMSLDTLVWNLITSTGYYSFAGAMPSGEERQANLRLLFEKARQFNKRGSKGLFEFIQFVDNLKKSGGDSSSARIIGEKQDVVRLMSVHKSKGLEFPVVILSGCGVRFNLKDTTQKVLLHPLLGLGPQIIDLESRIVYPSPAKQAIKGIMKTESLSEEMRILYVALTRAKEKLIIIGCVNNFEDKAFKWGITQSENTKISAFDILRSNSYMDWIGMALGRHQKGKKLRSEDSEYSGLCYDDSDFDIQIYSASMFSNDKADFKENLPLFFDFSKIDIPEEINNFVSSRLEYVYPYESTTNIPVKVSVTELKRRFSEEDSYTMNKQEKEIVLSQPDFITGKKGLTSAQKGTTMHFVMQTLDFDKIEVVMGTQKLSFEIESQIDSMLSNRKLTKEQRDSLNIKGIVDFFSTITAKEILASSEVKKEIAFNYELPACELYKDIEGLDDESILLQGVVDLIYRTDEGYVVLDYKSDYVKKDEHDEIIDRYSVQINYYAKAIEEITKIPVVRKEIYLFSTGEIVTVK